MTDFESLPASSARGADVKSWIIVAALLTVATSVGLLLDRYVSITSQAMLYVLAEALAISHLAGRLRGDQVAQ